MTSNRPMAAALALTLAASGVAHAQSAPFTLKDNQAFAACHVGGQDEPCLIDTGANIDILLRRTEAFDALPALDSGRSVGSSGASIPSAAVRVTGLKVGGFEVASPTAVRVPKPHPYSNLGLAFFRRMGAVTFDFPRAEFRREPSSAWPAQCAQPFELTSLILVPVTVGERPIKAAWDTGATHTVVSAAFVAAHPDLFTFVRPMSSGADIASNAVPARLYRLKSLTLCGRELRDLDVVAIDMSDGQGQNPDLPNVTLGLNLMAGHVWRFDFANKAWAME